MEKTWAITNDTEDLLNYIEARSAEQAVTDFVKKYGVPPADAELLHAIPGDKVRDDMGVPGWLLSAIEHGPEYAFGSRDTDPGLWEAYDNTLVLLKNRGVEPSHIVDWVRVNADLDLWAPVVE